MTRHLLAAGTLVVAGVSASPALLACGDKFGFRVSGIGYAQLARAKHPGSVLIYAPNGASGLSNLTEVQTVLTKVGHRVTVVRDTREVARVLAATRADVVLTGYPETTLFRSSAGSPVAAVILPILHRASRIDEAACRQQFPCRLKSTDGVKTFVSVVNDVMSDRVKKLRSTRP